MRSRGHAAATAPPADPCDEALAQVTAEQAALEKGMRKLLAVRKPTEEHNREYCRMKANHAAVLEKQAEVCRASVKPMASPWMTLWEVQKSKLPLPAPGASALEPATPGETDIPRKASTPQLFDGEGEFAKSFGAGSGDDDDSLRDEDEKEPMLPELTSTATDCSRSPSSTSTHSAISRNHEYRTPANSAALARAKDHRRRSVGWHMPPAAHLPRPQPSCRPIVHTTVYAAPLAQLPPPQPAQSAQ